MKTIIKAHIAPFNGRLVRWALGPYLIGSWSGPPPKGAIRFRCGYLNLFTGEYQMPGPSTNYFKANSA